MSAHVPMTVTIRYDAVDRQHQAVAEDGTIVYSFPDRVMCSRREDEEWALAWADGWNYRDARERL